MLVAILGSPPPWPQGPTNVTQSSGTGGKAVWEVLRGWGIHKH